MTGLSQAMPRTEDTQTLEVTMVDFAGVMHTFMAWQNNSSGIWTIGYANEVNGAKFFVSNETGYVRIT